MNRTATERGAILLGATILGAIIAFVGKLNVLEVGAPYFLASSCSALYSLLTAFAARFELREGKLTASSFWVQQSSARILHLVAWQLAFLGGLNVCASYFLNLPFLPVVVCSLTAGWVFVSDRQVALTDRRDQSEGIKPMNFFGKLRTRRLFFWGLIFYPATPLLIAGCTLYLDNRSHSSPFQPPQFFILFAAILSAGTASLAFQRYRRNAPTKRWGRALLVGFLVVLCFSGIFTVVLGLSVYTYMLSSLTVTCIAAGANLTLRASSSEPSSTSAGQSAAHGSWPYANPA